MCVCVCIQKPHYVASFSDYMTPQNKSSRSFHHTSHMSLNYNGHLGLITSGESVMKTINLQVARRPL